MTRKTLSRHVALACHGALRDAGRLVGVCALLLGLYVADRGDHLAALLGAGGPHGRLAVASLLGAFMLEAVLCVAAADLALRLAAPAARELALRVQGRPSHG